MDIIKGIRIWHIVVSAAVAIGIIALAYNMGTTTTIPDTTTLTIECIGGPEDYGIIHINGTPQAKTVSVVWANPTHPTTAPLTLACGVAMAPNNPIIISVR